jgi:hypothetical protein
MHRAFSTHLTDIKTGQQVIGPNTASTQSTVAHLPIHNDGTFQHSPMLEGQVLFVLGILQPLSPNIMCMIMLGYAYFPSGISANAKCLIRLGEIYLPPLISARKLKGPYVTSGPAWLLVDSKNIKLILILQRLHHLNHAETYQELAE